jgi:TRAP-type C4-dicarboxylate transport system permease small subunit
MRAGLDKLYAAALWASALCLAAIASLVGLQLAGRLIDGALALVHLPRTDFVILSLSEFCGYLLAAASFLALAGTLKSGTHIRVTMALHAFGPYRRFAELWAFAAAMLVSGYVTWHLSNFTYVSWLFGEVSAGVVRVSLWYPQAAMALGSGILTIALADECVRVWQSGRPSFQQAEDAITLGKEG